MTSSHPEQALWSGFFRKTIVERQALLELAFPHLDLNLLEVPEPTEVADNMIENCVGNVGVPLGLALHFRINGAAHPIPMAVEEPSVIAAVSGVAKLVDAVGGGFTATHSARNIMVGQVMVADVPRARIEQAQRAVESARDDLMARGDAVCASTKRRGGGLVDITARIVEQRPAGRRRRAAAAAAAEAAATADPFLVVHLHIDVGDIMGANVVTAVAEELSGELERLTGGRAACRILSNLCDERMATAQFRMPVERLAYKGHSGKRVAELVLEGYAWACADEYRASTYNKGVMNGIDAVCVAAGQDWRALEGAAHAHAVRTHGFYGPLTEYWLEDDGATLCGELSLPVAVGVFGGAVRTSGQYAYTLGLMGNPTAAQLAQILVCVGLAQNFAALRALTTEGIRRGHMSLHARNIAVAAGTPSHAVAEVVAWMTAVGRTSIAAAKEYMQAHQLLRSHQHTGSGSGGGRLSSTTIESLPLASPSMLLFDSGDKLPSLTFNVAFETLTPSPVYMTFDADRRTTLHHQLFGEKAHAWLTGVFEALGNIRVRPHTSLTVVSPAQQQQLVNRLKTVSILINLLLARLALHHHAAVRRFVDALRECRVDRTTNSNSSALETHSPHHHHSTRLSSPSPDTTTTNNASPSFSSSTLVQARLRRHFVMRTIRSITEPTADHSTCGASHDENTAVLVTGLSLTWSLLELFEYRVRQCVSLDDSPLAQALEHEQYAVADAIAANTPDAPYDDFAPRRIKTFQFSVFFLCDALLVDAAALSQPRLDYLLSLGAYFELEAAIAHDVARFVRDQEAHRPNMFVRWREENPNGTEVEFVQEYMSEIGHFREVLLEESSGERDFFGGESLLRVVDRLREHYCVTDVFARASDAQ